MQIPIIIIFDLKIKSQRMKPYTKYHTINSNQGGAKRLTSPAQMKKNSSNAELNKEASLMQLEEHKSGEKNKYIVRQPNDKIEEKSKLNGPVDKHILTRSKQKKDYIATNIAKLTRKKEQKRNDSVNSKKSNSQPSEKSSKDDQAPIYTSKYESKAKKVNDQYSTKPNKDPPQQHYKSSNQSHNQSIKESSKSNKQQNSIQSEQPSIQYHYNQTNHQESYQEPNFQYVNPSSIYNQSRSKHIDGEVVGKSFQDKMLKKKEIKQEVSYEKHVFNEGYNQNSRQIIEIYNLNENQKSTSNLSIQQNKKMLTQASRIQQDLQKQYQHKFIEDLTSKLKNQREEFSIKLHRLQKDKEGIQSKNPKLIQSQFKLQNQLQLTLHKKSQLQRQLQKMKDLSYKNGMDLKKSNSNNDRMFKQLQGRYNQLLGEYRNKIKQNADLSGLLNQFNEKQEKLKNSIKTYQEEINIKNLTIQNIKRAQELKLKELKQKYQFLMKQKEIKFHDNKDSSKQIENVILQLQKQLSIKNHEIQTLIKENQQLSERSKNKQSLECLLQSKILENKNFIVELNKNKKIINDMLHQHGQQVLELSQEIQEKETVIKKLNLNIQEIYRNQKMNKLSKEAKNQLYGNKQNHGKQKGKEKGESEHAFEEMIYRQTEDANKFKEELYMKADEIYQLKSEIDELREKLRRLQQDAQVNARTYTSNMNNLKEAKQATQMILKKRIAALQSNKNH